LPGITPSGIFSKREELGLIKHSGLIQFDIDPEGENLRITNWDELKEQIFNIRYVAYVGLSVSGTGYWGLIPISDPSEHKAHFKAIEKFFNGYGVKLDKHPSNVAALRYYSYDPDALFRHDAKVFHGKIKDEPRRARKPRKVGKFSTVLDIEKILRDMIRNAADGEKHHILLKAGRLAGGYVAGGQMDHDDAIDILTTEIEAKPNVRDLNAAIKTIHKSIKYGMQTPITRDEFRQKPPISRPITRHQKKPEQPSEPAPPVIDPPEPECYYITPDPIPAVTWQPAINELKEYFAGISLPSHPVKLNDHTKVVDITKFIEGHISTIQANDGRERFRPYLNRLQEIKQIILHGTF
jgi:hypothetical protein